MLESKISYEIERLINYALDKGLINEYDVCVQRNYLLSHFGVSEPSAEKPPAENLRLATDILNKLLDLAYEKGMFTPNNITMRDLESAKIMGIITPWQSAVAEKFERLYETSPEMATDYFYKFSQSTDYIQVSRTDNNIYWKSETSVGELEITINLSKPEKDPLEIAAAKNAPQKDYPKCLLCAENAGYEGNLNHPARQNHRIIPLTLRGERWYLQYSPYLYYNEHCIALNEQHIPMRIWEGTFDYLFDFLDKFPHYFIGSNADLPIVGGSILSHDHFQGGRHNFPMEYANEIKTFTHPDFTNTSIAVVRWPLSTIRLKCFDRAELKRAAVHIMDAWRDYGDGIIIPYTDESGEKVRHNTITPIARKTGEGYELDIVLRNNLTTGEYPLGVYHPHDDVHHIKKENIGLIEVMGLAILPARLIDECREIEEILSGKRADTEITEELQKHADWIKALVEKYGRANSAEQAEGILRKEIGLKFERVLMDSGVFKLNDEGLERFFRFLGKFGFVVG